MQVCDEDVVDARDRYAHGQDVLDAAGAEVEKEAVAIAQFNDDAGASLIASGREGATADEGDAHLILPDGLTAGEVIHPAADRRRWLVVWRELKALARPPAVGIHRHGRARLHLCSCGSGVDCGYTNRCRTRNCTLEHLASAQIALQPILRVVIVFHPCSPFFVLFSGAPKKLRSHLQ